LTCVLPKPLFSLHFLGLKAAHKALKTLTKSGLGPASR